MRLRFRGCPVLSSSQTTVVPLARLQLVEPEQLPIAVVEQDVEGGVAGVAPPLGDNPLPAPKVDLAMVLFDPHPLADMRLFWPHEDLPSNSQNASPSDQRIPSLQASSTSNS